MNKTLKRGDAWTTKDRLWMVVNTSGAILGNGTLGSAFLSRKEALRYKAEVNAKYPQAGALVVRLSDLSGIVQ